MIKGYLRNFISNPLVRMSYLSTLGFYNKMSDEKYLKKKFQLMFGYELDLENPQTFNEKLQWLKIHDHNLEYIKMVDKYEAKKYVAEKIGEKYIIPTLGIWDSFNKIDFDMLPNQFVLKCTHDSGGIIICKDKKNFDKKAAKKKLNKCLHRNYYYSGREWPYKYVKPRIIAEQYMVDESGIELKDYKIFNFSGEPKIIQVDYGRFAEHKRNLYTTDWKYIDAAIGYPTDQNHVIKKPEVLDEMISLAKKLSDGIPHVRTDFYCIEDKVYFGELTFYHESGFKKFTPEKFGVEMGEWIELPGGYL